MTTVVLDTDGVALLSDPGHRARYRALLDRTGRPPVVPAAVLAEAVTGTAGDARLRQFLKGSVVVDIGPGAGLTAGRLRSSVLADGPPRATKRRPAPSGIDALVVAVADDLATRDDVVVLTSDQRDLGALASFATNPVAVVGT